jgi:glycosyltransferase involved in cell wall biosynthesis
LTQGDRALKILFLDFSTGLTSLDDLHGPRRGLINSLLHVPDALSKLNNEVMVISDIKEDGETEAGVKWLGMDDQTSFLKDWDFLVINRGIGMGYLDIKAKHRILWTHDLPHNGFAEDPDLFRKFSGVVFMSEYAGRVWKTMFPQIGQGFLIPNGVDKKLFYPREKDLDYLLYAFHPIRGVNRLPLIFGSAREALQRNIHLEVFSSFYKRETLTKDHMDGYPHNQEDDIPEGMTIRPALPIEKIAEEFGKAGLVILPTGYPEICSNSVLQSLASGTPIVTTGGLGSVPEWVKHRVNGWLTQFTPADYVVHQVEIMRGLVTILKDRKLHNDLIEGAKKTKIYDWEEIGTKWQKMFEELS